jgi:hypothetical protein
MDITKLATSEEIREVNVTLQHLVTYIPTFTMFDTQYYRITGPIGHPHLNSDMTMEGMKDWLIIPKDKLCQ